MKSFGWVLSATVCFTVGLVTSSCAPLPRQAFADVRKADYLAAQSALSPEVARAIETGRLVLGMTPEHVSVVLGGPDRRTRFEATGTEVWVYRAGRVHLSQLPDGIQAFRVVFIKDRLVLVEPL